MPIELPMIATDCYWTAFVTHLLTFCSFYGAWAPPAWFWLGGEPGWWGGPGPTGTHRQEQGPVANAQMRGIQ